MGTTDTVGPPPGGVSAPGAASPAPRPRPAPPDRARGVVRVIGELLITAGLVVLLFVVYEVYVTDLISAGKQRDATSALDERWRLPETPEDEQQRVEHFEGLGEGAGFAKMYVPAFGPDYSFTILEGTTEKTLEVGPGHYTGTAYPGDPGNFAVAGHRVGKGAPFNDVDLLASCDAIVVETRFSWFVYRVLPRAEEVAGWQADGGTRPQCRRVAPLGDPDGPSAIYRDVVGQEIVAPSQGSVVSPVPHHPEAAASTGEQVALMTLTTCHPKFSDRQRLVVHAVLDRQVPKDQLQPGEQLPELKETS